MTATVTIATAVAGSCQSPPQSLAVEEAHQLMQQHLRCLTETCPARQAALTVLVAQDRWVLADPVDGT